MGILLYQKGRGNAAFTLWTRRGSPYLRKSGVLGKGEGGGALLNNFMQNQSIRVEPTSALLCIYEKLLI